jgi:4-amino-4-deoxy-L-arabinose transferase-like glycosyltransferase
MDFLPLLIALALLLFLSGVTITALRLRKSAMVLFFVVVFIHLAATLVIHYTEFYPFGGGQGDQKAYHIVATAISEDFRQGIFSHVLIQEHLRAGRTGHYYPVIIGGLYGLTIPDPIVGKMVSVWFAALSALLVYWVALEIKASPKGALIVGFAAGIYPSYLYFGSLLLRESIVACFTLASMLLIVKLMKQFSWTLFSFFYMALFILIHFRFYVGLAVLFTFIISWFIASQFFWRKRIIYGGLLAILLGFIPLVLNHGFYGISEITYYLQADQVTSRRVSGKIERSQVNGSLPFIEETKDIGSTYLLEYSDSVHEKEKYTSPFDKEVDFLFFSQKDEAGSTVIVWSDSKNPFLFLKSYITSFFSVALGPFPWHIKYVRQLLVLAETIPWLVVMFFTVKGLFWNRKEWRLYLPILLVAFGVFAEIALLLNNYGTYMRIRIPAFLVFLPLLALYFRKQNS